jgi:hypothetical protein
MPQHVPLHHTLSANAASRVAVNVNLVNVFASSALTNSPPPS